MVADPAFAFESLRSRSGKNWPQRFLRNEPNVSARRKPVLGANLEFAGVEFIDENGGCAGVRLKKPSINKAK
jgi:hypothetical protein